MTTNPKREQVREELLKQKAKLADPRYEPTLGDREAMRFLRKKTDYKIGAYSDAVLAALTFAILDSRRSGKIDSGAIKDLLEENMKHHITKAAMNLLSDAWNMGRSTEAQAQMEAGEAIDEGVYTAIMEQNGGENCRRAKNTRIVPDSGGVQDLTRPLH